MGLVTRSAHPVRLSSITLQHVFHPHGPVSNLPSSLPRSSRRNYFATCWALEHHYRPMEFGMMLGHVPRETTIYHWFNRITCMSNSRIWGKDQNRPPVLEPAATTDAAAAAAPAASPALSLIRLMLEPPLSFIPFPSALSSMMSPLMICFFSSM